MKLDELRSVRRELMRSNFSADDIAQRAFLKVVSRLRTRVDWHRMAECFLTHGASGGIVSESAELRDVLDAFGLAEPVLRTAVQIHVADRERYTVDALLEGGRRAAPL